MNESMKLVEKQLGTFALRETKQTPAILDCFGWCTWDAFYQEVNPKGIIDGLKSLTEGGTAAKFLIIDDGWQDTSNEFQKEEGEPFIEGSQFGGRLVSIKENQKFRRKEDGEDLKNNRPKDLKEFSLHDAAEFHAAARAVGVCAVYVSLLKIWNLNNCTGVLGVFNCQGAGTWPGMESTLQEGTGPELTGQISPSDIEFLEEVTGDSWTYFAVFSFKSGSLNRLSKEESLGITLKVLQSDIFTVSPIKFAPIGLLNMYNSGGAVEDVGSYDMNSGTGICIRGRGSGVFGAFSSTRPKSCSVTSREERFEFGEDNLLTVTIPSRTTTSSWDILISY